MFYVKVASILSWKGRKASTANTLLIFTCSRFDLICYDTVQCWLAIGFLVGTQETPVVKYYRCVTFVKPALEFNIFNIGKIKIMLLEPSVDSTTKNFAGKL